MGQVQAITRLLPEDYALIVAEHYLLDRFLEDIREIWRNLNTPQDCPGFGSEKLPSYKERLPSFLHDIVDLAGKHFLHEESIMLSRSFTNHKNEHFLKHRKSHEQLLERLNSLAVECSSLDTKDKTAEAYRHFYDSVLEMFEEHDRSFDTPFIQANKN